MFGVAAGPKQPKHPRLCRGHRAPQPAWVTGPRHGTPSATATQVTPERLHSVHTVADFTGLMPDRSES